jgi:hypothetical protein
MVGTNFVICAECELWVMGNRAEICKRCSFVVCLGCLKDRKTIEKHGRCSGGGAADINTKAR